MTTAGASDVQDRAHRLPAAGGRSTAWWAGLYVLLAFLVSWVPWIVVLATTGGPTTPASRAMWGLGGLAGPVVAAVVGAALSDGRGGVRRLWHGLRRWRVGGWYLLLLAPLPVGVAAVLIGVTVGPAEWDLAGLSGWYLLPFLFLGAVLAGGLEEVGWRGYLLPLLQGRLSALPASMLIGVVWAGWHVPLFLMDGTTQASWSLAWFTLGTIALSVVLTWAYNGSGGSLLLVVLAHAALNTWYGAATGWLAPDTITTFLPYAAVITAAGATVIIWRFGWTDLAAHPRQRWPVPRRSARALQGRPAP